MTLRSPPTRDARTWVTAFLMTWAASIPAIAHPVHTSDMEVALDAEAHVLEVSLRVRPDDAARFWGPKKLEPHALLALVARDVSFWDGTPAQQSERIPRAAWTLVGQEQNRQRSLHLLHG